MENSVILALTLVGIVLAGLFVAKNVKKTDVHKINKFKHQK